MDTVNELDLVFFSVRVLGFLFMPLQLAGNCCSRPWSILENRELNNWVNGCEFYKGNPEFGVATGGQ